MMLGISRRSVLLASACSLVNPGNMPSFAQASPDADKAAFMKAAIKWIEKENREAARRHKAQRAKNPNMRYYWVSLPRINAFGDWDYFYSLGPIGWAPNENQNFKDVNVPTGFVTDLASIPRPFWSVFPKTGRYAYAAIVHDYLYWTQTVSRDEATRYLRSL